MVHPDELSQLTATERAFIVLQDTMMELHENEETFDEAVDMAEQLLLEPHLPLLARARCHMVLSCMPEPPRFAVSHAKEAVRLLNEDLRTFVRGLNIPFPQATYEDAIRLLHEAEEEVARDALAAEQDQKAAASDDTTGHQQSAADVQKTMDVDQVTIEKQQSESTVEAIDKPASVSHLPAIDEHGVEQDLAITTEKLSLGPASTDNTSIPTPTWPIVSQSTLKRTPSIPGWRTRERASNRNLRADYKAQDSPQARGSAKYDPETGVMTPQPSDEMRLGTMVDEIENKEGVSAEGEKAGKPEASGRMETPSKPGLGRTSSVKKKTSGYLPKQSGR